MRISLRSSFTVLTTLTLTFFAKESLAQDQAPAPSPSASETSPQAAPQTSVASSEAPTAAPAAVENKDKAPAAPKDEEELKHVAITANPLSLILTRVGLNVEYLPIAHHAITLNPYFQSNSVEASAGTASSKTSYTTFGSELGYRFYTGTRGANGFFVGPAVFLQKTSSEATSSAGGQTASAKSDTTVYGAILDIGGQHVTKGGFTLGAGIGAMYLVASTPQSATSSTVKFEGFLPRILLTAGYSF